ncbi:CorA family divalent cation transporter [Ruminococcus sp.]|uniref:magnesium transporter CorA family protein n=1 Tax=Ruminococcus sp. TaxID=41978 RepID=UPI00386C6C10
MYYLIRQTLVPTEFAQLKSSGEQYVAVLTPAQWAVQKESFDMGIDIEPQTGEIHSTKAEVNYDSLTGSFSIPDRSNMEETSRFAFALDEKGVVFIDDCGMAQQIIHEIKRTKKWRLPSLERFIYDFLEMIINLDRDRLESYDSELSKIENLIEREDAELDSVERANEIRGDLRILRVHYEQLLDFTQELEENENNFFKPDNLRYFRLFSNRIERFRDTAKAVEDHAVQIRDIYKAHTDIKQNRIMTVLTVVTTIFMPLTLIVGWYGMNFRYMPELDSVWGYPVIIAVSLLVLIGSLLYFKKKKWL